MDIQSLFGVKDKVVLVTGGAKGIGRMISEAFVVNGARVYIASRDAKACAAACAELNALPGVGVQPNNTAIPLPADLSQQSECQRVARELVARGETRLHVLVNNSGAAWGEAYDSYPDAAWTKLLTLNLQRVFTLTQALTPLLEAASSKTEGGVDNNDPGRVIHIGSIDALRVPLLPTFAYSASKAGLHHLSRHLAVELGPRGVTSNTLACGPFPSKMMAATLRELGDEIREANPLGRIGMPSDVGGACLFLASRAGAFVNGATVALDGGVSLMSKI
ncbi:Rhamnolipids biosynthesis 3-oxoacyl-reductase [Chaetomidium leptoderma]|uniref:Rhamnolipids biosynthesis 3-oxoacyl-reductase n=1 Tax=Chaetomidium leptoderma TaxID=669021 RepID=A0AAN6VP95_9PEZI|nr:Rhamnolipids biosynthesis 3-oxoacyl-reductase [Chaetomidium leptoderma]